MINRRRNFRSRTQKNSFRRRNSSINSSNTNNFNNNGNVGFTRNGSMNNIFSVEGNAKISTARQCNKAGDPVLAQNYLQHEIIILYNELNDKANFSEKNKISITLGWVRK